MPSDTLQYSTQQCAHRLSATEDAIYVLGGRWTLRVMIATLGGHTRFNDIQRSVKGISAKVLSSELRKLEQNLLLKRTIFAEDIPVVIEYLPTEYSRSLKEVITALSDWGAGHKKQIVSQE